MLQTANAEGIFPVQWMRKAVEQGIIQSGRYKIPETSFQPASLDLRLGGVAYRLRCSFLPDTVSVQDKLRDYAMDEVDLRDGAILEKNRPYLIPLVEQLNLPRSIRGRTNPKSSTGRLDIFTRVITDHSHQFDQVRDGYRGTLYLEVASRSFTIKVREGLSLNQLRLIKGDARCPDDEIRAIHRREPLLFVDGHQVDQLEMSDGLFLGVDLSGDDKGVVGYKARKNSRLLDLSLLAHYDPEDFWEPVHPEEPVRRERKRRLVLEPEEFYLLLSAESVRIPPDYAAEMTAYDPTNGELRTHYAGFFDPGFGYDARGLRTGTRAVMEVRAHDVPFVIENGQKICRLEFARMAAAPDILYGAEIGSSYQYQELTLSKHFRPTTPPPAEQLSFF